MRFVQSTCGFVLLVSGLAAGFSSSTPAFAQTSPSAHTFATRFDEVGRVVGTIAPDPDGAGLLKFAAVRNTYDDAGRLVMVETGELSVWKDEYTHPDDWGTDFTVLSKVETDYFAGSARKKEVRSYGVSGGTVTLVGRINYSYDLSGRLKCTAQRLNLAATPPADACTLGTQGSDGPDRITRNIYDVAGQVTKVQKAYGTTLQQDYVTYTYDDNGNQLTVTDAGGNKAAYEYDGFDRLAKWSFPDKVTAGAVSTTDYASYTYDNNSNILTRRTRRGETLSFTYDVLNRMTVKTVPERTGLNTDHTRDVYYGYDNRGLQLYARFGSAAPSSEGLTTSYDGFGRMETTSFLMDGVTRTLAYEHNKNGARTKLTHWDAHWFSYDLDGLDRVTSVNWGDTSLMRGYSYNNRGLPAGNMFNTANLTSSFGYDSASRLSAQTHNASGTTNDVTWTFGYNSASQLKTQTRSNDAYAWAGAANDEVAYQVNGLNQYTSADGAAFSYDLNGNLTSDGDTTYVYDVENRLVSATGTGKNVQLEYDPMGRLYQVNDVIAGSITRFLWDGDELIAEFDGNGVLMRRHLHGASVDDPIATFEGSAAPSYANVSYPLADRQGSIIALSDQNGNVTDKNAYDEYGVPDSPTSAQAMVGRFGYTGQAWIPELGLWHYKARFYSPTLGRFMQVDPIGYEDQVNLYAYVGNDPMNMFDPSGMLSYGELHSSWGKDLTAFSGTQEVERLVGPGYTKQEYQAIKVGMEQIKHYNPISQKENREYGGWVYADGNDVKSTEGKPGPECGKVGSCSVDVGTPESNNISPDAAILNWHTHGANKSSNPRAFRYPSDKLDPRTGEPRGDVANVKYYAETRHDRYPAYIGMLIGNPQNEYGWLPPGTRAIGTRFLPIKY